MELNIASICTCKLHSSGHGKSWKIEDTQKECVLVKHLTFRNLEMLLIVLDAVIKSSS